MLACVLFLGGCGEETASVEGPTAPRETPSEAVTPGEVAQREVAVLSGPNGGGAVSSVPVRLPDAAALETWVSQFESEQLRDEVRAAAEAAWPGVRADDEALLGVVLSIGCEQPDAWSLERVDGDLRVSTRMPKPTVQCLVATTTVGLLAVDEDEAAGLPAPQ